MFSFKIVAAERLDLLKYRKAYALLLLILICFTPHLYSYTFLGIVPPGDPVRGHSAKTSGMGNISAACIKDEPNLYFNPASLLYTSNKQVSLSLNYIPAEEKIIVKDQPPVLNFQNYTLGALSLVLPLLKEGALGFGVIPLNDMQYRSKQRTYRASILAVSSTTVNIGTLYSYTISGAYRVGKFAFGLGINFLKTDYETIVESYDFQYSTYAFSKTQNKLDGPNLTLSTVVDLSKSVLLGASYIQEYELEQKNSKKLKLPTQYTLSTTLNMDSFNSVFAFELIFTENKKTEFHLGVEHLTEFVGPAVPIRYGVGFVPHPADNSHYAFLISAGSGVKLSKNVLLDFAGSYETTNTNIGNLIYIQQNSYKLICSTKIVF
ncbi:MAG: hypothetical protein QME68_04605 [Elusimicrobiota bacterium]|nr:hypothetical protein [Elusimicrobiota bacterium]